jgi:hypothetical protein
MTLIGSKAHQNNFNFLRDETLPTVQNWTGEDRAASGRPQEHLAMAAFERSMLRIDRPEVQQGMTPQHRVRPLMPAAMRGISRRPIRSLP